MECGHRGTRLCGNGSHTFPWRVSGILEFVRTRDFTSLPRDCGTAGFLVAFDCPCGASDAFTHLARNVTQFRSLWFVSGSCSCPQVKCKRARGLFWVSFVQEWNIRLFCGAGAGCYNSCGTHFMRASEFSFITEPRDYPESRTKPREKSPRMPWNFAPAYFGKGRIWS